MCLDLLGPFPMTGNGNRFLFIIVDRFTKLTPVVPIGHEDAETVVSAFLDTWIASDGSPETLLTDNGPQLTWVHFRAVCEMLRILHIRSTKYHPQSQGQVESYDRTIVAQVRTYVEDNQKRWDELVSVLTVAYNTRPQQSTVVAPFEFVIPMRVRMFALDQLTEALYAKKFTEFAKDIWEARWARFCE